MPTPRPDGERTLPDDAHVAALVEEFSRTMPFPLDPFQHDAIVALASGQSVLVAAPTGTGKALEVTTPVLTPLGWKPISEIHVGDCVIGSQGKPITVLGVHPQGRRPAYRVTFSDGVSVVCDIDHLWAVNTKWRRSEGLPWRVLTLRQIMSEGITDGGGGRKHFIPIVKPVEFRQPEIQRDTSLSAIRQETGITQRELATLLGVSQWFVSQRELGNKFASDEYLKAVEAELAEIGPQPPLEPYLLGLLLGDGNFSNHMIRFTSADDEIIASVQETLPRGTILQKSSSRPYDWYILSEKVRTRNPLVTELIKLGLMGHRAETKFIPRQYKFASVEDRIALLQGLLDSDGSIDERGIIEYTTVSHVLVEDTAFLVRSLGGRTRIKEKPTNGQLAYRLFITMPDGISPFRLTRKVVRCRSERKYYPTRSIDTVEPVGEAEMVCISVDAPDGLFVVNDFIVTHNTVLAECAIWLALREGKRAFYTAPIKALSNQKFRDFRDRFGARQVGLMTGDIVENASAPIVVMTTEIYRNVLLEIERGDSTVATTDFAGSVTAEAAPSGQRHLDMQLDHIACVIFDELHFMADPQRGPVWEECIIHSPPHVRFVGLSATVRNADEMVAWMTEVHGPTSLIFHPERAVPLEDYYFYKNKLALVRDAAGQRVSRFPHVGGEAKRRGSFRRWELLEDEDDEEIEPWREAPQPDEVLAALKKADLLPCLYFLPGRRAVEDAAHVATRARLTDDVTSAIIADEVDLWLDRLAAEDRALQQVQDLAHLLPLGMAFHHAGLMPSLKMLVETLFARGLLQAVFATDTLAMGVNMPARAVVLGSLSKFDGIAMRMMTPNEYQQLTGRAGRRGMDERGAAVILYSPWEEFETCFATLTKPLLPVSSAFTMRYNSVLNLWRPGSFERLRRVAAASFLEYHRRERQTARRDRKQHEIVPKGKKKKQRAIPDPEVTGEGVELGNSVEHELIATATILRMLGYLDEVTDDLSLKGRLLRAIFHPAGIALSELMLAGALDNLTSAELAEVVSWFTYDSDRPLWAADVLSERLKIARRAARGMVERVRKVEFQQGLTLSPALNERFMGVALGWSQRLSLGALSQRISLAEGDLLMVLNQTIDLLRQLESATGQLLADTRLWTVEISPMLSWAERRELRQRFDRVKATLGLAARSLMHGTVAQSRSLPFRAAGLPVPPEVAEGEAAQ